ncbi:nibrin-related [Anaeramoeba flamelloides]|uniref:Nibrin-related n=1 Tax=Anaeramoeba flamelloides TaxID=1746091 RepID=A0ABQ8X8H1_9EUKA|nr:nibrin-related [Anaeramoeba flamelloides]
MWKIEVKDKTIKYLYNGQLFKIGRGIKSDLQINDLTVSRLHLQLEYKKGICFLQDFSRYGTKLNGEKITGSVALNIIIENRILLGGYEEEIIVSYQGVRICDSYLTKEEKFLFANLCQQLSFPITTKVDECTHLVMTQIGVTTKFLISLIEGKTIVSLQWLQDLHLTKNTYDFLDEKRYLPKIIDNQITFTFSTKQINLYLQPKKRKSLFINHIFLFLSQDICNASSRVVQRSGAKSFLIELSSKNSRNKIQKFIIHFHQKINQKSKREKKILCIVDPLKECPFALKNEIKKLGFNLITEVDFGLAIIQNSTSYFCSYKKSRSSLKDSFTKDQKINKKKKNIKQEEQEKEKEKEKEKGIFQQNTLPVLFNQNADLKKTFNNNDNTKNNKIIQFKRQEKDIELETELANENESENKSESESGGERESESKSKSKSESESERERESEKVNRNRNNNKVNLKTQEIMRKRKKSSKENEKFTTIKQIKQQNLSTKQNSFGIQQQSNLLKKSKQIQTNSNISTRKSKLVSQKSKKFHQNDDNLKTRNKKSNGIGFVKKKQRILKKKSHSNSINQNPFLGDPLFVRSLNQKSKRKKFQKKK